MSLISSENFNSYSNGASLASSNGGFSWAGVWAVTGTCTVSGSVVHSSPLAVNFTASGYSNASRSHPPLDEVYYEVWHRTDLLASSSEILAAGPTGSIRLQFPSGGTIVYIVNGSSFSTSQAFTINTWYKLGIYMNRITGEWKIYFGSTVIASGTTSFGASKFDTLYIISPGGSNNCYFDDISIYDNDINLAPPVTLSQSAFLTRFV